MRHWILLAATAACACASAPAEAERPVKAMNAGMASALAQSSREGRSQDAASSEGALARPDSELARAEYQRGVEALARGERLYAEARFLRALEADPDYSPARERLESLAAGAAR